MNLKPVMYQDVRHLEPSEVRVEEIRRNSLLKEVNRRTFSKGLMSFCIFLSHTPGLISYCWVSLAITHSELRHKQGFHHVQWVKTWAQFWLCFKPEKYPARIDWESNQLDMCWIFFGDFWIYHTRLNVHILNIRFRVTTEKLPPLIQ